MPGAIHIVMNLLFLENLHGFDRKYPLQYFVYELHKKQNLDRLKP